jgi:hypothetical protein
MMAAPEFGKDVRRDFEVSASCYDCATFYDGCAAWRASRDFACGDFNRLPDVGIDGAIGQEFPPSRRRTTAQQPIEQDLPNSIQPTTPEPAPTTTPTGQSTETDSPKARICGCGADLTKGKRLCDACRTESRRRTKRQYMRGYMEGRRSGEIRSDPDVPITAQSTHATHANAEDLGAVRPTAGVPLFE